ncbi:MAG TPA: class I SAM-dependent methyltransferase [Candidatus Acidoferrales bacterium]|nr:class I SAM-dependent methyltransferase [Candidatus Acidoferrales bacterium]
MQQGKVKVTLGGISASMLSCLWGRAQLSKEYSSLFYDAKAVELSEKIDYDLSTSDVPPFVAIWFNISRKVNRPEFRLGTLRAKQFDDRAKVYIAEHPHASVINIAAGLDTTFYRVDNGLIHWYDLDLPAVIDVRRQLLPEPDRVTYIAKSLLDPGWCKDIKHTEDGVFMIAGGALGWFDKSEVEQFFLMLADNFPGGEIVFDAISRLGGSLRTWMDMFPPEQRETMRAAWMEALKDWWEKAPQNQKDKLNDMIAELKTPTKPNGKEWSDLEAWWDQLGEKEGEEVVRDLMTAFRGGTGMWALEDVNEFTRWDNRIAVLDQFPLYRNIPRDSVSADMRRFMDYSDKSRGSNIIHLRL